MKRLLKASIIISVGFILPTLAQIPRTISYQGVLTDAKGNPRPDGSYDLTFALYVDSTGGTKLWQETKSLAVTKGMFSTSLGDMMAISLSFDRQYWLGIAVGKTGQEFSQRIKLSAAAYSFGAVVADSARKAALSDSAAKAAVAYRVIGSGAGVQADTIKASMVMAKDTFGVKVVSEGGVGLSVDKNGNVGIGTIRPLSKFDITSSAPNNVLGRFVNTATDGYGLYIRNNTDNRYALLINNAADNQNMHAFFGNGDAFLANIAGKVGIGTTSPIGKFEVRTNLGRYMRTDPNGWGLQIRFNDNSIFDNLTLENARSGTGYGSSILFNLGYDGNDNTTGIVTAGARITVAQENTWGAEASTQNSYMSFATAQSGVSSEKMRITSNGNVGIGVASPAFTLDINRSGAAMQLYNSAAGGVANFFIGSNQTASASKYFSITHKADDATNGALYFIPNSTTISEATLVLQSSGNVGIGTTTPDTKLECHGSAWFGIDNYDTQVATPQTVARFFANGINATYPISSFDFLTVAGYNNSNSFQIRSWDNISGQTASLVTFHGGGNVGIGTDNPCSKLQVKGTITANEAVVVDASCTSDRRFKTILAPISSALDKIKRLSGVLFTWKRAEYPDRNFPEGTQIGLIAQDVEKVLPELVHTDAEGYKSLSYDKLTAVLVEAVKEQQNTIERQQQIIERLDSRIKVLETNQ
jgi:hypothetical protein